MGYWNFKRTVLGSYLDRRNPPYFMNKNGLAHSVLATTPEVGNNYDINRFNPQKDRLEDGSVLEEWIPRQPTQLHLLFRKIWLRDAVAGAVVDLYSTLPWGKVYELIGIDDPKVLQMYHDMIEAIGIWHDLPLICREVQIIGRMIGSLAFNEKKGIWDNLVPVDPDQAKLTPMPFTGVKPLVDVLSSPAWREFARSTDPRIVELKETMNTSVIELLQNYSGYIPLEPANTLFVARRVNQYDHIGTSLYTRILPAWAYEMALWNASLTGVRRRNRSILLVTAGQDETWEPNDAELSSLTSLFMQADEDPTGAVIAVRQGVDVSEVRDPTAIWGISQEFEFLSTIKMRSLGVSEAYLSGEVNVSTMEAAKSSLGKSVASFRDFMIREIFTRQLFPTFARIHNFRKVTQAELAHGIRTGKNALTAKAAMEIPYDELLMPQLITEDTLRPEQDPAYLEMLEKLEGHGVPIPLRIWASAAGYDLDKAIAMMEDDITLRRRLAQLVAQNPSGEGGEGGGGAELGGGGGGEAVSPADQKGMEDLFKGEGGGEGGGGEAGKASSGGGGGLPPKWQFQNVSGHTLPYQTKDLLCGSHNFDEKQVTAALNALSDSPLARSLSRISPNILADLRIPASRALMPYIPREKELKSKP
jgi:hypothetical protein